VEYNGYARRHKTYCYISQCIIHLTSLTYAVATIVSRCLITPIPRLQGILLSVLTFPVAIRFIALRVSPLT
jgi:hypothetical protein